MFSRSAGYAVKALTYLAGQPPGKLTGAREIATATEIPMPFLWKILRNLSRKKLVRSFKGVRGGYELARSAERITVQQILAASHDQSLLSRCVLGLDNCDGQKPCTFHEAWRGVRNDAESLFRKTTVAQLSHHHRTSRRKKLA